MPNAKVLESKKAAVETLSAKIKEATSVVFVDYKGITVAKDAELRKQFREAGVEYTVDAKMGIPSSVYDKNNLAIVAIVMNYYTDEVLNVVEVKVPDDPTGIHPIETSRPTDGVQLILNGEKDVQVICPAAAPFTVEVVSVDGRHMATWSGEGSGRFNLSTIVQGGIYVLRISQGDCVWTKKVVL